MRQEELEGIRERDKGMAQALGHAEDIEEDWGEQASRFLYQYAKIHIEFSGEMVRNASYGIIPEPPSKRAWGTIMHNGAKKGWIRQIGYVKVINPKAHRANAALWESCL